MGILSFEKPQKVMTKEEYKEAYQSDTEIDGTYQGNMSDEDAQKWRGKFIDGEYPRVEIRKSIGGSKLLVAVSIIGLHRFKQYGQSREEKYNVRVSMNGPCMFSFQEWYELNECIEESISKMAITCYKQARAMEQEEEMEDTAESIIGNVHAIPRKY